MMSPCILLLTTLCLILLTLGNAWAGKSMSSPQPAEEADPTSNIESWNEEVETETTWFGMGFESRKPDSDTPGQQRPDRVVNNW